MLTRMIAVALVLFLSPAFRDASRRRSLVRGPVEFVVAVARLTDRRTLPPTVEGSMDRDDNPLKHAPHTASAVVAEVWRHRYGREQAAYPMASLRHAKYWPPIGRVDNVYGDRNLFCSCVPVAVYETTVEDKA